MSEILGGMFILKAPRFRHWLKEGRLLRALYEYHVVKAYQREWAKDMQGDIEELRAGGGFMEFWRSEGYATRSREPRCKLECCNGKAYRVILNYKKATWLMRIMEEHVEIHKR